MIDVTEYAADGCRFTASASNKNGKGGATASAVYRKTQALSSPCNLIAKGTVLSWECSAPDAKFHVIVDGIIVAETGERSYDFSTIVGISFTNKKHSVYVTAEKSGYYTAISNTIEVTFGEENERI